LSYDARVDIRNRKNITAAGVAHNAQISRTILDCVEKSTHFDFFDSSANVEKHTNKDTLAHPKDTVEDNITKPDFSGQNIKVKTRDSDNSYNLFKDAIVFEEDKRSVSLLFKAIKMGDISFISDYFGVAIDKSNNNREDSMDDFDRSIWYVEVSPDNVSEKKSSSDEEIKDFIKGKDCKMMRTVDVFGPEGFTPLHAASKAGSIDIVQFLLSVGASPELRTRDGDSETALHIACKNGHLLVAKALINVHGKKGDILDYKDRGGNTALHHCVLNCNYELAKLLIRNGADLSIKNSSGKTAKEEAIEMNHLAVLDLMRNTRSTRNK